MPSWAKSVMKMSLRLMTTLCRMGLIVTMRSAISTESV